MSIASRRSRGEPAGTHCWPCRRSRQADETRDTSERDGGYVLIEFLFWAPFLLLVILPFAVLAGRLVLAGSLANGAAADAARAASLQRTDTGARTAASVAAEQSLQHAGISCHAFTVRLTGSVQPGGVVTVTVSCTAPLSDLAMPGVPGSKTLTATASAPIELTRGVALGFRNPDQLSAQVSATNPSLGVPA